MAGNSADAAAAARGDAFLTSQPTAPEGVSIVLGSFLKRAGKRSKTRIAVASAAAFAARLV